MLCVSVQSGSSFLEKEGKGGEGGEGREEGRREDLLLLGPPSLVLPRAVLCMSVHCSVEDCSWLFLERKEEKGGREGREGRGGKGGEESKGW